MAHVRLKGLTKRYGTVEALRGLDLDIEAGEFFCLLGPSAAGKTTSLRCLAGLETLDAGVVEFAGRDITRDPVQARDMAMIFQTFALYPHFTTRQNLAYPLRQAKTERGETARRVEEMAELLRIGHTLDRKPNTLSGGEQQRLAIGRALIGRPALLLLDEPLTNLDAKLRHDTRAEFKRLHRELRMTMLYATPDQLEALTMGERIAVMEHGRIIQTDTPERLYRAPDNTYVAGMVGAPPMNLIGGRTRAGADGIQVELPFAAFPLPPDRQCDAGVDLLIGIRPHDLQPADTAHGPSFDAQVHLTEPLGDVTVLDMEARGEIMKIVLSEEDALQYRVGDRIKLTFPQDEAHFFYKETGISF